MRKYFQLLRIFFISLKFYFFSLCFSFLFFWRLCVKISVSVCVSLFACWARACYIYFCFWFFSRRLAVGCCCHFMCFFFQYLCVYFWCRHPKWPLKRSSMTFHRSNEYLYVHKYTKYTFPNLFRNSKMSSVNFIPCVFFPLHSFFFFSPPPPPPPHSICSIVLRAVNNAYKHWIKCARQVNIESKCWNTLK